jgi:hypothetical protein
MHPSVAATAEQSQVDEDRRPTVDCSGSLSQDRARPGSSSSERGPRTAGTQRCGGPVLRVPAGGSPARPPAPPAQPHRERSYPEQPHATSRPRGRRATRAALGREVPPRGPGHGPGRAGGRRGPQRAALLDRCLPTGGRAVARPALSPARRAGYLTIALRVATGRRGSSFGTAYSIELMVTDLLGESAYSPEEKS